MKKKSVVIIFALVVIVLISITPAAYAGGQGDGGAKSKGQMPVIVKAAFDIIDPVFRSNLKPNAAIAVFPVSTFDTDDSEAIYEQLQINIVNSDKYTIVEKRHVDQLLEEHDFQRSGLVSDDTLISFGKLLGADAVLLGSVKGKGADRRLVLIAVDMEKRTTLATAVKPWPQVNKGKTDSKETIPAHMGIANVLFLPVLGGTDGDNTTMENLILSLRDINDACNLIDMSKNTSLLPANFTGFSVEDNELLYRLGVQYKARYVIHSSVQKYGQRNLAIISKYDVYSKRNDKVNYLEYIDPVEAWIKLPGVISGIMKSDINRKRGISRNAGIGTYTTVDSADNYVWVRYRDGADRLFARRMLDVFFSDLTESSGFTIRDITNDLENAIEMRQGVERYGLNNLGRPDLKSTEVINRDWRAHMDNYVNDLRAGKYKIGSNVNAVMPEYNDGIRALFYDIGLERREIANLMIIEVSAVGNKTRFQLLGAPFTYTLDFANMRDFIRQVRGLSLSVNSEKATAGYDLGIIQGVKYNYWKYSGEDSGIPEIITNIKPYFNKPHFVLDGKNESFAPVEPNLILPKDSAETGLAITSTTIKFFTRIPEDRYSPNIFFYYSTEKNFSKAVPIETRRRNWYGWGNIERNFELYGLKPDTKYYIWAASCYGFMSWLQSEPVMAEIRTKAQ